MIKPKFFVLQAKSLEYLIFGNFNVNLYCLAPVINGKFHPHRVHNEKLLKNLKFNEKKISNEKNLKYRKNSMKIKKINKIPYTLIIGFRSNCLRRV